MDLKKTLLVLFLVLAIGYWWMSLPSTVKGPSSSREFEYIVKTSANGGSSDALPMVIALHGDGDSPAHFYETLLEGLDRPARFVLLKGPSNYIGGTSGSATWPRDSASLKEYGDALAEAVPVLLDRFSTRGKPIVLGFSSGAFYAYYLAVHYPDQFSYIFPLSGALPRDLMETGASAYDIGTEVIAFHGKGDQVVGLNRGKATVALLRKMGLSAELITVDGGHIEVFLSGKPFLLKRLGDAIESSSL
jgi:phospholipase/carboxylesterase